MLEKCLSLVVKMIGRFASSVARTTARRAVAMPKSSFRLMSSLEKKERGDEARYFAQQEADRLNEMKAKVEAIMASDDHSVKEHLEEVLGKYYTSLSCSCIFFYVSISA